MNLSQTQYGFVIALLQTIPRAFDMSEDDDDDDETSLEPLSISPSAPPTTSDEAVVDLLPELSSVAKAPDGKVVQLKSSLELTFAVGTIYLELFTAAALSPESLKDSSLARFSLNETGVKYKMLTNGAMEAEVVIRSFTVHDTRTSRQTKFREIIPATSHSGHQFMINFTQSGGTDKSAFANVTIDSPKVIFSLDPLFALLDYFMSAFPKVETVEPSPEEQEDQQVAEASPPSGSTFAFRVNVVSPTIIMLDNPERSDSEAVILSISQVQMAQQGTLALTVSKIGMFLCKVSLSASFSLATSLTWALDRWTSRRRTSASSTTSTSPSRSTAAPTPGTRSQASTSGSSLSFCGSRSATSSSSTRLSTAPSKCRTAQPRPLLLLLLLHDLSSRLRRAGSDRGLTRRGGRCLGLDGSRQSGSFRRRSSSRGDCAYLAFVRKTRTDELW